MQVGCGNDCVIVTVVVVGQPFDELAVKPETLLFNVFELFTHEADSILLAVLPLSSVRLCPKRPRVLSIPMSQVVFKLAFVLSGTIRPFKVTIAVHLAVEPLTAVNLSIRPLVNAFPANLVLDKGTLVGAAIGHSEQTLPFFEAELE